jgi:hypothetical protein
MLKKYILLIPLLLIATLIVIFALAPRDEVPRAYAVCRNQMLSVVGCDVWVYQRTRLNISSAIFPRPNRDIVFTLFPETGVVFIFSDGSSEAYCSVYRDASGWHPNGGIWGSVGACPNRASGMYGVSP